MSDAKQAENAQAGKVAKRPFALPRRKSPMVLGKLGLSIRTSAQVYRFLCSVWTLVAEAHDGAVDALNAKRIRSAALTLAEALRAQTRLAQAEAGKLRLSEEQIMGWSDRVVRNHAACDRILERLGLDKRAVDPWDGIYNQPGPLAEAPASAAAASHPDSHPSPQEAPGAKPEAQEGTEQP